MHKGLFTTIIIIFIFKSFYIKKEEWNLIKSKHLTKHDQKFCLNQS